MSDSPIELHRLSDEVAIWHRYDPKVKADLFSTALATAGGLFFVDPIAVSTDALGAVVRGRHIAGVIVTNANHERDARSFAEEFAARVYGTPAAEIEGSSSIGDGDRLADDLMAIELDGAAPGEIALYCERDHGTLVVGDALINFGSHGFSFLPVKYVTDPKAMRKSLQKLLDYSFARILFAHGTPIIGRARERLAALLDEAQ